MITSPELETKSAPLLNAHLVILLDDEATTLTALRRALRGEPYELLATDDPSRVLHWVDTRKVSLVVSDLRMSKMEGTELLEEVRRRSPPTVGVILTGYPEYLQLSPELKHWIQRVILKPWEDQRLRMTLRQLLHEREESSRPLDLEGFEPDIGGEG